jgi:hypoxanthine phosphoribosyltransferase
MASAKPTVLKVYLTWEQIAERVRHLAGQLKDLNEPPTTFVPVARGGLIVAGMLSYITGIYESIPVLVKSYSGTVQKGISESYVPKALLDRQGKRCLIVDDICDTGDTLRFLKTMLPAAQSAVLLSKTEDHDFMTGIATNDFWYVFPWEASKSLRKEDD